MPEIKFTTSADLKGINDLEDAFKRLEDRAKRISDMMAKAGVSSVGAAGVQASGGGASSSGVGYSHSAHGYATGAASSADGSAPNGAGQKRTNRNGMYNLYTPAGVEMYTQNVMELAAPVLAIFQEQMRQMTKNETGRKSSSSRKNGASAQEMESWFAGLSKAKMPEDVRSRYSAAMGEYANSGSVAAIQAFADEFGAQYGAPQSAGVSGGILHPKRLYQHFRNNAKGGSMGSYLSSGLKGVGAGILGDAVGGGVIGEGAGLAIGEILGGPIGMAAAGITEASIGYLKKGFTQFMESATPASQLAHSLGDAAKGVETFRSAVVRAGAASGLTGAQSFQVASLLAGSMDKNTRSGIENLVHLSSAYGLNFGMNPQQIAQLISASSLSGVTNGVGAQYTPSGYLGMLGNMVLATGMKGRQGQLFTGLADVYNTLSGINPIISNQSGVAAQYTALNSTGIQGLQGQHGAALIASMDKAFASPSGIQQAISMAAILKASGGKITDPFQMMSIMEQGTSAKVGDTTLGAAYQNVVKGLTSNPYLQGALMPGLDINQGMAMFHSGAMYATKAPSTRYVSTTSRTTADKLNEAVAKFNAQAANLASGPAHMLSNVTDVLGYSNNTISMTNNYLNQLAAQAKAVEQAQETELEKERNSDPYARGRFGPLTPGRGSSGGSSNPFSSLFYGIGSLWGNLTGDPRSKQIYSYLRGKGLTADAAAGVLGNLQIESGLNPTVVNSSSGAFGIAQWLGSRKKALTAYAAAHHSSATSLHTQLQFLLHEMNGANGDGSIAALNSYQSPAAAAQYFEQTFERAGSGGDLSGRMQSATKYYNQLHVSISPQSTDAIGRAVSRSLSNHNGPVW